MYSTEFVISDLLTILTVVAAVLGFVAAGYAMYVVKKDDNQDDD